MLTDMLLLTDNHNVIFRECWISLLNSRMMRHTPQITKSEDLFNDQRRLVTVCLAAKTLTDDRATHAL